MTRFDNAYKPTLNFTATIADWLALPRKSGYSNSNHPSAGNVSLEKSISHIFFFFIAVETARHSFSLFAV